MRDHVFTSALQRPKFVDHQSFESVSKRLTKGVAIGNASETLKREPMTRKKENGIQVALPARPPV